MSDKRPRKSAVMFVRMTPGEHDEVIRIAVARDVPASQVAREAIRSAIGSGRKRSKSHGRKP